MTAPPTARQRRILYESGRWDVVELLTETDDAIKRAKARRVGDTGFEVDGETYRRRDTAHGIELHHEGSDQLVEIVTWATVAAIAAEVPDDLRTALADHRRRSREHQAAYPLFAASKAAVGCGNPWAWVRPLTERQAAYEAEWEAWQAGPHADWLTKREQLDEECELLLSRALLEHEDAQAVLW